MSDEPVVVARVARAHGIRGGLLLKSETDVPEALFREGRRLQVVGGSGPAEVELLEARPHSGRWLVFLRDVSDRTSAERLRGARLTVPRSELPDLAEGGVLLHDLIGLDVAEGETVLGEIRDIYDLPAGPMLSVRVDDRERLIPFDPAFVEAIDFEAGRVVVSLPEGLLEI